MKPDLYTKTVLTVIACCLLYLCFSSRQEAVHAQEPASHVIVDNQYVPVSLVGVSQDSYHPFYVPVTITNTAVPVNIVQVGGLTEGVYGALPVSNPYTREQQPVALTVTVAK
jgi:hypothetical protein